MNFNIFYSELRPIVVFNTQDIRKIDKNFNYANLTNWQKKELIQKLAKGFYTFPDYYNDKFVRYFTANKIIEPSYISCGTALAYYNVASFDDEITSVCPTKSYTYKSEYGGFKYHRISSPALMTNINIIKRSNYAFRIASLEKAIVDYFFFNPKYQTKKQIIKLSFDQQKIKSLVKYPVLRKLALEYRNKALLTKINNFSNIFL